MEPLRTTDATQIDFRKKFDLTDKVIEGSVSEAYFRRYLSFVVLARFFGTILGQFTFIPLAQLVTKLASFI